MYMYNHNSSLITCNISKSVHSGYPHTRKYVSTLDHIFHKHILSIHTYTHLHICSVCLTIIHTKLSLGLILYIITVCLYVVLDFLHSTTKKSFFTSFVFHSVTKRLSLESTHKPLGPRKQHVSKKRRKLPSLSMM